VVDILPGRVLGVWSSESPGYIYGLEMGGGPSLAPSTSPINHKIPNINTDTKTNDKLNTGPTPPMLPLTLALPIYLRGPSLLTRVAGTHRYSNFHYSPALIKKWPFSSPTSSSSISRQTSLHQLVPFARSKLPLPSPPSLAARPPYTRCSLPSSTRTSI